MVVCVLAVAGCRADELQFKNDRRLTFVTPDAYDEVTVPLTISWTMDDFEATGLDGSTDPGQGAFAVFVDRAPMPVGKDLAWVGRNDPACKRNADCPDEQYLAEHGVYVTTESSVTLDHLPTAENQRGPEQHYANVVLVDGTGRRIGESAWYVPFTTERRPS